MKYAEYCEQQKTISLNLQLSAFIKSFLHNLTVSSHANLINHIVTSVQVQNETQEAQKDFHLYRIQLNLVYNKGNVFVSKDSQNSTKKEQEISYFKKCDTERTKEYRNGVKTTETHSNLKSKESFERTKEMFINTAKCVLHEYTLEERIYQATNRQRIFYNLNNVIISKSDTNSKDLFFEHDAICCAYFCIPSSLIISKASIQSIHVTLNDQMRISLSLRMLVHKKNNSYFNKNEAVELDQLLLAKKNVVYCRFCNSSILSYSHDHIVMPHMDLHVTGFFEHAFCEECSEFSFDILKKNKRRLLIFPNFISIDSTIINDNTLSIKRGRSSYYRNLLFCNSCYESVGYIERGNDSATGATSTSYTKNIDIHEQKENWFLSALREKNLQEYMDLKLGEKGKQVNEEEDIINDETKMHHSRKEKTFSDIHEGSTLYLLKHKIKIFVKDKNIFNHYEDSLFLNEYMHNRCAKFNISTFYIQNDKKKQLIEIKIFIKKMYIIKIAQERHRCMNTNNHLIKVMKVLYCLCQKCNKHSAQSELIPVSKELYESTLQMLIHYSTESEIFKSKFMSYLLLTN